MQSNARICVPVCARMTGELGRVVARAARAGDVIELRLDCLEEGELARALKELEALAGGVSLPLVFTFRPSAQGGGRDVSLDQRFTFWAALARARRESGIHNPAFADLELDLFESARGRELAGALEGFKLVCSHHDFGGVPSDLEVIFERMMRTPASVLKVAVTARDATDCLPVLALIGRGRREGREVIAVAMGSAGVLTRVLAPSRGSFLTYGSLDASSATAPGQVTAEELRDLYGVHAVNAETLVTGLVGLPVAHSLSPHMHNAAFRALGVGGVYVPFEVANVSDFLRRMVSPRARELDWPLRGLSVTAPHKTAVLERLDWAEPRAREAGAVNTIVVEGEELRGYNTDAEAALAPLAGVLRMKGSRAAVLGSGGAARSLLLALREAGARMTVFARRVERARGLAEKFGAGAEGLDGASFDGFDLVVNATPLGTRGELQNDTPATAAQLRGARVAYDLVYNPARTRFLREAREAGCETVGGLGMLVAQAERQFELWTGLGAPAGVMRGAAEKTLAAGV
ncbi:MAG TPA: shikimate dehydrogenase [Pyrinomonadaceae bacterium]|nr:shikimate dehydrogenase [Pyrinomonadaceae bacterium]